MAASLAAPSLPVGQLVKVVAWAILEVVILCLAGWILSRKGIIDERMKKGLNKINVSLFTPALLFSKVAFSLTPQKLAELWIVPVGFVIVSAVSAFVAWVVGFALRLDRQQRSFAMACSMFGNSNSLPIAIMQSLVATVPGLKWGADDDKDSMLGRALSYLVLYSTLGIILRWSIGVRLLSAAGEGDDKAPGATVDDPILPQHEPAGDPSSRTSQATSSLPRLSFPGEDEREGLLEELPEEAIVDSPRSIKGKEPPHRDSHCSGKTSPTAVSDGEDLPPAAAAAKPGLKPELGRTKSVRPIHSFPALPHVSVSGSSRGSSDDEDGEGDGSARSEGDEEDPAWGVPRSRRRLAPDNPFDDGRSEASSAGEGLPGVGERTKRRRGWEGVKARAKAVGARLRKWSRPIVKVWEFIADFMTVPLWAALLSIIIACIPPVQHFLDEDFVPLKAAIRNAGNCSVPVTLVTLGAYFNRAKPKEEHPSSRPPPPARRPTLPARTSSLKAITMRPRLSFVPPKRRTMGSHPSPGGRPAPTRQDTTASVREQRGQRRTVFVSIFARMIGAPLVLLPPFWLYATKTTTHAIDDPVFLMCACLIIGSPPAITLAQITSAASGEVFETLISRTLLLSYSVVTPPTTIILALIALWMDSFQNF